MTTLVTFLVDTAAAFAANLALALIGIGMSLFGVAGALWARDRAMRARPALLVQRPIVPAAEDIARFLRIRADDALWTAHTPAPAVLDQRTAVLVVDPTLKPAEVAEMVEHVAPGAGSVVSVADEPVDTRLRTMHEEAELASAWDAATAESAARAANTADGMIFATFRTSMDAALNGFRAATARVDAWAHYLHDAGDTRCPHCTQAVADVSGEYRALVNRVELESTQSWSRHELATILAG